MAQSAAQTIETDDDGRHFGSEQVAAVYAKSFLGAAEAAGQADALVAEFSELVDGVVRRVKGLEEVLSSRLIGAEQKVALLDKAFAGKASPLVLNFLKVLANHGRLDCLKAVAAALEAQLNVLRNRVHVHVVSASPLDDDTTERLKTGVRNRLGVEPILDAKVDPALVGGVVLRVGDTVYDGSISSQLEAMRVRLINRSVHEIQTRRDRFRTAN